MIHGNKKACIFHPFDCGMIIKITGSEVIQIWNEAVTVNLTLHEYDAHRNWDEPLFMELGLHAENWKTLIKPKCEICFNASFWGEHSECVRCYGET